MPNLSRMAAPAGAAPLRPVRLGAPDAVITRRPDGTIDMRASQPLPPYHRTLSEPLEKWAQRSARARVPGAARRQRCLAPAQLCASARHRAAHRRRAAAPRAVARAADRHALRQRHRARAARARRHACRHPLCADLAGLFADVERLRQAAHHHRPAHARPGVRHRRQGLRPRLRRRRAGRRRTGGDAQSAGRPQGHAVRRSDRRRRRRRRRRRARGRDARHHRQVPVHLRLDRQPQGRDQHPAHAVRQPGHDRAPASASSPTSRRWWSTGCPGATPSAATTTST